MSELKAILWFFGLLVVGIFLWDLIGFDSGNGSSPYGESPYYQESI